MHVVINMARLAGPAEQAVQRARDHVAPLLSGRPGFRGCCGFIAEGDGAACLITLFDDRDAAEDAQRRLGQWFESGMRDLVREAPSRVAGETVFDAVEAPKEQLKDRQAPLHVVIRTWHGLPGQAETMHSVVSQHTLPAITSAPGFRGFYAFRDEAEPDRAVSVTLFDSREEAMRSHERVLAIMQDRLGEMAYQGPRVTMGETALLVAG